MPRPTDYYRVLSDWAERVARGTLRVDDIEADWLDESDRQVLWNLIQIWRGYIVHCRRRGNRRGYRLLRSLLTPEQNRQLTANRAFYVPSTLDSNIAYRLIPSTGVTQRCERHGRMWVYIGRYCYHHDDAVDLPHVDLTIAHLLMLQADENAFLDEANETASYQMEHWGVANQGWASEWRRRLNANREARLRAEYEATVRAELRAEGVDPDEFLAELQGQPPMAAAV